ncbi:cobalamin-binding protein [Ideonella sp. TBM-1]|uniref:Cobalamin-binding protein n=1 Tax=Ideonella livida TaxID=2707176 RepID=A0A7C9TIH0_9BURK|nr:cobalamin-binding protein [Ideonella livida]
MGFCSALALWGAAILQPAAAAPVTAVDDEGRTVSLAQPAQRIIGLGPHTTELLFAAGAGDKVVATVRYGDYPEAAKRLPQVGDAHLLDLERIAALKPDLLVVWMHGSAAAQIDRLRALRIPVFYSEPRRLADVGSSLRRLGALAGTPAAAQAAADRYDAELAALRQRHAGRPPLRVFYQVWHQPLLTVNGQHMISDVIGLCGGVNVFGPQAALVPQISQEAVLTARPQVLVTSTLDGRPDDSLRGWQALKHFEPIARQRVVLLPADHISRPTPRLLLGARQLCEALEGFRVGMP